MLASAVPGEALVAGPSGTASLFAPSVAFEPVAIRDRPRLAGDVLTVLRLGRLLRRFRPGVVHAHGLRAGALTALALSWRGRAALVVTVHNAPPAAGGLAAVYRALERIVAWRADLVLCVSGDLAARMRRLGAREVDLALVPAPSAWSESPAAVAVSCAAPLDGDGRPVVLGVGRLAPQKRFDVLLRAAATRQWRARQPAPLVVIAGAGPLAGDLDRLAAELGVDARFLGERDDVPALLAAADVFVLPSQWEGQPLILQEALRAGRPIVASDVGGVRDLTGDAAAVLVAPGDPLVLSLAVLSVLDDERLASRLAVAAAARAGKLPAEAAAVASVIGHYDRLARLRAARTRRA